MKFDDRYSRQVLFPGIGMEGQTRLARGKVAIVGCGATGASVSGLLARAGVGHLLIIDRDYVEPSNLQRQSLPSILTSRFKPRSPTSLRKTSGRYSQPPILSLTRPTILRPAISSTILP
jgi:hypothetical protein